MRDNALFIICHISLLLKRLCASEVPSTEHAAVRANRTAAMLVTIRKNIAACRHASKAATVHLAMLCMLCYAMLCYDMLAML